MEGFKKFILRGNVVDLAIGVVIGAAFTAIITSIVNGLVNPLIGLFGLGSNLNQKVACIGTCSGTRGHQFLWGSVISAAICCGCSANARETAARSFHGSTSTSAYSLCGCPPVEGCVVNGSPSFGW